MECHSGHPYVPLTFYKILTANGAPTTSGIIDSMTIMSFYDTVFLSHSW